MLATTVLRFFLHRLLPLCAEHFGLRLASAGSLPTAPACSAYAGRLLRQQAIVARVFWLLSLLLMAWVLFTAATT